MALSEIELDALVAGDDVATDLITARHYQYVKMTYGAAGTANEVTSTATNPFPVALSDVDNAVLDTIAGDTTSLDGKVPAAAALTDNFANPTTTIFGAMSMLWDGATWDRVPGSSADGVTVNLGANNDVTVTGTVTVDLGANNDVTIEGGAVLGTDGAAGPANALSIGGTEAGGNFQELRVDADGHLQIDALTSALPTGAATETTLATVETNTNFGTVTGGGVEATALRVTLASDSTGTLTVDNAGTFAVQSTLQTGSNTVGEVTIGAATGAAGDLAKQVDNAAGASDIGVAMLAVRDDEQAALTPVDGDYTTLRTDRFGNLKVTQLPDATSAIQYGVIDAATSGDNTLQAAAGVGIKIRVLSVFMVAAGTVNARFESGAAGTALTGQMNLVANSGFTLPFNPAGWFETADNTLLNLELSAAVSVDGCFTYVEV